MSCRDNMIERAKAAMQNAYSPYSHFKVGSCIRTDDDQYFTGCNIENMSFGLTICAETCALSNLISHGGQHIAEVAITCSTAEICGPCGGCRQRLAEFADPDTPVHMCNCLGESRTVLLGELLPMPFSQQFLQGQL